LPVVRDYGFDRWWIELHRHSEDIAQAEQVVEWWKACAELDAMHIEGELSLEAIGDHMPSVTVYNRYSGSGRVDALARALVAGVQVGWLLANGALVPVEDEGPS
jgi:hypothetical protein